MRAKYIKLRPVNQTLITETLNRSLLEVLKTTQHSGIMNNEIDNLFRCKKTYKFADGTKAKIRDIVPLGHNLYSFLAFALTSVDFNEPIERKLVEGMLRSTEVIKKALLLNFDPHNMALIKKLDEVNALWAPLLSADLRLHGDYIIKQGNHKTKVTVKKKK